MYVPHLVEIRLRIFLSRHTTDVHFVKTPFLSSGDPIKDNPQKFKIKFLQSLYFIYTIVKSESEQVTMVYNNFK